jgi:hypothetical protein
MSFGSGELEMGLETPIGIAGLAAGEEKSEKGILINRTAKFKLELELE